MTIRNPKTHFDVITYTGNGGNQEIGPNRFRSIPQSEYPLTIAKSVRLRASASAYLSKTLGAPTTQNTFTFSCWFKTGTLGTERALVTASSNATLRLNTSDKIQLNFGGILVAESVAVYRNPTSHLHIVWQQNGTAITIWVNNQSAATGTGTNTEFNTASGHEIGRRRGSNDQLFDGYLSNVHFVDGQALLPTDFGQWNDKYLAWVPKAYTGTYGTNGFFLNFNEAGNTSGANTGIGKDVSGNGNYWNSTNIDTTNSTAVTYDWMNDSPTNSYATLNPLDEPAAYASFGDTSTGNLKYTVSNDSCVGSTVMVSSGKWYWETHVNSSGAWCSVVSIPPYISNKLAYQAGSGGRSFYSSGVKYNENTSSSYGSSFASGTIVGCALDLDAGKVYWSIGGVWQNTSNPVAGTGEAFSGLTGSWMPTASANVSGNMEFNFGQRPFTHTVPTGFLALCQANLPTKDITEFPVDLAIIKNRDATTNWSWQDRLRGFSKTLSSNTTDAETTDVNSIISSTRAGLQLGNSSLVNTSAQKYVAYLFKGGNPLSISVGDINYESPSRPSDIILNKRAGYSIAKFNSGASNGNHKVAHALGKVPDMVITRETSGVSGWLTGHVSFANRAQGCVFLNTTDAAVDNARYWANGAPTASVFYFETGYTYSANRDCIAYCFAEVPGFSKFGSYVGNGSNDGPFIYCGFRPKFVLIKSTNYSPSAWELYDGARRTYNPTGTGDLQVNSNGIENASTITGGIDLLSNGFKIRDSTTYLSNTGSTYIYAAFAEFPGNDFNNLTTAR
jgi:hypothetical protein